VVQDRAPVHLDLAAPWCDYPMCMASENVASAEFQNAHGAVASVQDAPPPNEPAMLTRGLDHVAKVIAIASVAVYGTGFIVAVHWYSRCGVPTAALTHEVVLGAGVQFMLVCMSCLAPLVALRLGVFGKPTSSPTKAMDSAKGRMRRTVVAVRQAPGVLFEVFLLLTVPLSGVHLLTGYVSPGRSALFVLGIFLSGVLFWKIWTRDRLQLVTWKIGLIIGWLVMAATLFSSQLYSRSPPWLGGARPIILRRDDPTTRPTVAEDAWAKCSASAVDDARTTCRTVYVVYRDEKFVYTAVTETDAPCVPEKRGKPVTLADEMSVVRRFCFISLPSGSAMPLRLAGPLGDGPLGEPY
jgi:hypothetical protein